MVQFGKLQNGMVRTAFFRFIFVHHHCVEVFHTLINDAKIIMCTYSAESSSLLFFSSLKLKLKRERYNCKI